MKLSKSLDVHIISNLPIYTYLYKLDTYELYNNKITRKEKIKETFEEKLDNLFSHMIWIY